MKTIQELYSEIMESQELKAQFIEAAKAGKQEEFLKAHGCEATLQEVQAFLTAKQSEDAPLSFDELKNASGGGCIRQGGKERTSSTCMDNAAYLYCIPQEFTSITRFGSQDNNGDERLCNK